MEKKRYYLLDSLRGMTLISMILYHGTWDLVYIFGVDLPWYQTQAAYIWQQSICWTFILLSGFCWSLSRHNIRRGLLVFGSSILISVVTCVAMPENRILFGVLSLIGTSMLLLILLEHILRKIQPSVGALVSFLLFIMTRNINTGFVGTGTWTKIELPKEWYANLFSAYIGFPSADFWSTDYFSIFPWIFLYVTGYFLYQAAVRAKCMHWFTGIRLKTLEKIGRHSLVLYLLHQPLLYGVLYVVFEIIN